MRSGARTFKRLALGGVALAALGGPCTRALAADNASAHVTAEVVVPISVAKNTDLNFGRIASAAVVGTVVLRTSGGRTVTGGASASAASFTTTPSRSPTPAAAPC